MSPDTFGSTVRREREKREIGLREAARAISVSPTYLSVVERGQFPPPSEEKVRAIAKLLGQDEDELLALAGKVSSDLAAIIRDNPKALASFLRSTKGFSSEQIASLARRATGTKKEEPKG